MPSKNARTIGTIVVTFGVTVVLTLSVLATLPALVRADRVKAHLAEKVKAATGHDLSIGGTVTVSLFPSLSVHVTDVALHSPPRFAGGDLLRAAALDAELDLLPLLSGQARFNHFVLLDPAVTLEVDHQGRTNWAFASPPDTAVAAIRLGETRIIDGRVTYVDDRSGRRETAKRVDMTVRLANLDAPLSARGSLSWHGRPVTVAIDLDQPRVLADGSGGSPANVALAAGPMRLAFAGRADAAADTMDGDLELSAPSLSDLAGWLSGQPLDPPDGTRGKLALKATLAATPGVIALHRLTATLDGSRASGDLALATGGPRPAITGTLAVEGIDLAPWLPPLGADWSTAPIDASALRTTDLDLGVKLDGISAGKVRAGPGTLTLALRDGRLTADLADLALYGGSGRFRLTVDGSERGVAIDAAAAVEGVQAGPLLAAAGFDRLAGTAAATLHLGARGGSARQLVASLTGDARAALHDGAAHGIDLATLVRKEDDTAFTDLTGSWTVAAGIVTCRSLALRSPGLDLDGSGTVDLTARTLAYRLVPREPTRRHAAPPVPLVVEGPWDHLSVKPAPAAAPSVVNPAHRPGGRRAGDGDGR
jgi:AsmA protein